MTTEQKPLTATNQAQGLVEESQLNNLTHGRYVVRMTPTSSSGTDSADEDLQPFATDCAEEAWDVYTSEIDGGRNPSIMDRQSNFIVAKSFASGEDHEYFHADFLADVYTEREALVIAADSYGRNPPPDANRPEAQTHIDITRRIEKAAIKARDAVDPDSDEYLRLDDLRMNAKDAREAVEAMIADDDKARAGGIGAADLLGKGAAVNGEIPRAGQAAIEPSYKVAAPEKVQIDNVIRETGSTIGDPAARGLSQERSNEETFSKRYAEVVAIDGGDALVEWANVSNRTGAETIESQVMPEHAAFQFVDSVDKSVLEHAASPFMQSPVSHAHIVAWYRGDVPRELTLSDVGINLQQAGFFTALAGVHGQARGWADAHKHAEATGKRFTVIDVTLQRFGPGRAGSDMPSNFDAMRMSDAELTQAYANANIKPATPPSRELRDLMAILAHPAHQDVQRVMHESRTSYGATALPMVSIPHRHWDAITAAQSITDPGMLIHLTPPADTVVDRAAPAGSPDETLRNTGPTMG